MKRLTHALSHFKDFPCDSAGKESACNAGDLGSIPCLGKFLGEGKGYPLQYSGLENSPHGLLPTRLLPPWNSPGKNTGVGCHFLLQGIFQLRDWTWVSHTAGRRFNLWVIREARTTVRGVAKSWIGLRTERLSLSAISNP